MALTKQPTVLKHKWQLDLFEELSIDLNPYQLAETMKISVEHVNLYLDCLKEGQTLAIPGSYDTKKMTAEELVEKHKGKLQYMAWA